MKSYGAIALLALLSLPLWAEPGAGGTINPTEILDRYVKAVDVQHSHPEAVSMEVDMDAKLPRLKKQGRLHAFRFITRVGQIFYKTPHYEGDNTIKKEVIGRYLQAEKDAKDGNGESLAVTPENYKFKFMGIGDYAGQQAWVFEVTPKKKRVGLFRGELWLDQTTYLPLREWGQLVKSPSVFLKKIYFVRDYTVCNGLWLPRRLISDIDTRIIGRAELTIWYENVKVGDSPSDATAPTAPVPVVKEASRANGGTH